MLAGCSWMSESDLLAEQSPGLDAATLRAPAGAGPFALSAAQNARRRADDDEQAVDARELTRATAKAGGPHQAAMRRPALPKAGSGAENPPRLNVLYVANGRIRAFGPAIWIRGTVDDDTDGVEVTVNGQKATVKDRSFRRRVPVPPGETEMEVRAEDADGNVTASRFLLVRSGAGQSLPAARPPAEIATPEYRLIEQPSLDRIPRIEDVADAGVYMVLMAGTPSAHFVKMPNLAQCREAVEYTENAACTFHKGRD
jgi:hypothetical protein